MPNTPAPSAPTPSPAPKQTATSKAKSILTDARMILGYLVAGAEAILTQFPTGPIHTALVIGIPVLGALIHALTQAGG